MPVSSTFLPRFYLLATSETIPNPSDTLSSCLNFPFMMGYIALIFLALLKSVSQKRNGDVNSWFSRGRWANFPSIMVKRKQPQIHYIIGIE